jgi:hypothetical protein
MDELSFLVHLYPKKCWFVSCGVQIWEVTHISPTTKQRHVNRDYRVTKGVTSPASCYHLPRPESESEGYLFFTLPSLLLRTGSATLALHQHPRPASTPPGPVCWIHACISASDPAQRPRQCPQILTWCVDAPASAPMSV